MFWREVWLCFDLIASFSAFWTKDQNPIQWQQNLNYFCGAFLPPARFGVFYHIYETMMMMTMRVKRVSLLWIVMIECRWFAASTTHIPKLKQNSEISLSLSLQEGSEEGISISGWLKPELNWIELTAAMRAHGGRRRIIIRMSQHLVASFDGRRRRRCDRSFIQDFRFGGHKQKWQLSNQIISKNGFYYN